MFTIDIPIPPLGVTSMTSIIDDSIATIDITDYISIGCLITTVGIGSTISGSESRIQHRIVT